MKIKPLDREEWDFSSIPKNECANAWRWEIFRELERVEPGFGLKRVEPRFEQMISKNHLLTTSYLSLKNEFRSILFSPPEKNVHAFREIPFERAPQTAEEIAGEAMVLHLTCSGTHVVQIAWDQPKTRIIKEFGKWIAEHKEARQSGAGLTKHFDEGTKVSSQNEPKTWLKDLAIYRAAKAGHTITEAADLLGWISKTRTTAFSRSHFSDSRRATKRRLENLVDLLRETASRHRTKRKPKDYLNPFTVPIRWFVEDWNSPALDLPVKNKVDER
jgi:hypothetical protein